jgi:anti-sigma B factor antagonist
MKINEKQNENITVIMPHINRLDASNSSNLKNKIVDLYSQNKTQVVLNMEQIDFMDSSGLAALLSGVKTLGQKGELALAGVSETVRKLFTITRLDRGVFNIFDTEENAVKHLLQKNY